MVTLYFVDREVWMKQRVLRHNMWDSEGGVLQRANGTRQDLIYTEYIISFDRNIMIFDHGHDRMDTLILKWQYFGTMKVMDPKNRKVATFGMKGSNWIDYLFN